MSTFHYSPSIIPVLFAISTHPHPKAHTLHSLYRCPHRFTTTPALAETTSLCYKHTALVSPVDPFTSLPNIHLLMRTVTRPFPESTPLVINTHVPSSWHAHTRFADMYSHRFTSSHPFVENTPLCYKHTALLSPFDPFAASLPKARC